MSKILIIEDEPAIRRVLIKILSEEDKSHEIDEAENGIDAINQLLSLIHISEPTRPY